jgi:hypothetical protein
MIPARFVVCALFVSVFSIAAACCSGEKAEKPVTEQYVDRLGQAKKDAEKVKVDAEKATGKKLEEATREVDSATKNLNEMEKKN